MNRAFVVPLLVLFLSVKMAVQADVFNMGPGLTNLETVTVGDPGNAGDYSWYSVSYVYKIGKYEVTTGQYAEFLNAVARSDTNNLYDTQMWNDSYGCKIQRTGVSGSYSYSVASDRANRPVNYVSFWDACRFTNWLNNRQPSGEQNNYTTEKGAYDLEGYNINDGRNIGRNTNCRWAIPSNDEWGKAAYYKGGGVNSGYWEYATQSNTQPSNKLADLESSNSATYHSYVYTIGSPYYRTEVGAHINSASAYGTYDQSGNVSEWNEDVRSGPARGYRGGSYDSSYTFLRKQIHSCDYPFVENATIGFRVVQLVPEPSSIITILGGISTLSIFRRRKA